MNAEEPVRVVTGATSGIGRALALQLAAGGGTIVLVGRDESRAQAARTEITRAAPGARVEVQLADLSSQTAVRELANRLAAAHPRIATLVNCAAVFSSRRVETADGLELMFATNHLAPFLLTNLLLPSLKAGGAARVLTVTAPSTVKLDFDDLQGARRFRALMAFGASKAANLLFVFELARRIAGSGVTANAVHPGLARTGLMRQSPALLRVPIALLSAAPGRVAERIAPLLLDEQYAKANGEFFHRGRPIQPPRSARDPDLQHRLWEVSERLTGLT
jgi:NAD(P)-dependent dehydrogenase (short-subunit alcohol dehydrogenase family)